MYTVPHGRRRSVYKVSHWGCEIHLPNKPWPKSWLNHTLNVYYENVHVICGLGRRIRLIFLPVYVDGNIGIHAISIYLCQLFINDFNNGDLYTTCQQWWQKAQRPQWRFPRGMGSNRNKWEQCSRRSSVVMRVLLAVQRLLVKCMAADFRTPWASGCLLQPGYFV